MTSQDDIGKKIAEFLSLMILVRHHEKEGGYDNEEGGSYDPCPNCKSKMCSMIQKNNDLQCWLVYAKNPDTLYDDLSNNQSNNAAAITELE